MYLDTETLRKDLQEEAYGAYFGGGFGAALVDAADIENASPEELIETAEKYGKDISEYTY